MEDTKDDFSNRLEQLIKLLRFKSVNAFASSIGVGSSVVQNFLGKKEKGKKGKPNLDTIEKIITSHPRVNLDWLVRGIGEPLRPLGTSSMGASTTISTTSGHVIGTMHGGNVTYSTVEDCMKDLETCRGRVKELEATVTDKQMIIDLLQKSK